MDFIGVTVDSEDNVEMYKVIANDESDAYTIFESFAVKEFKHHKYSLAYNYVQPIESLQVVRDENEIVMLTASQARKKVLSMQAEEERLEIKKIYGLIEEAVEEKKSSIVVPHLKPATWNHLKEVGKFNVYTKQCGPNETEVSIEW